MFVKIKNLKRRKKVGKSIFKNKDLQVLDKIFILKLINFIIFSKSFCLQRFRRFQNRKKQIRIFSDQKNLLSNPIKLLYFGQTWPNQLLPLISLYVAFFTFLKKILKKPILYKVNKYRREYIEKLFFVENRLHE